MQEAYIWHFSCLATWMRHQNEFLCIIPGEINTNVEKHTLTMLKKASNNLHGSAPKVNVVFSGRGHILPLSFAATLQNLCSVVFVQCCRQTNQQNQPPFQLSNKPNLFSLLTPPNFSAWLKKICTTENFIDCKSEVELQLNIDEYEIFEAEKMNHSSAEAASTSSPPSWQTYQVNLYLAVETGTVVEEIQHTGASFTIY